MRVGPVAVAIGDIQGCFDCLRALVGQIDRASVRPAPLWLVGDLVNRGPKSLETLRWAMENDSRIVAVLGNHDLHLLAAAAGVRPLHRSDTLDEILSAPDRADLLDWVRRRPLAHLDEGHLMIHAGVLPQWSAPRTVALAGEVSRVLSGPDWKSFLRVMYGNAPARWHDALTGADRLSAIVNALTRMRFCSADGTLEFASKEGAGTAPAGFMPWFDVPGRASANVTVVFGHWSTLGFLSRPNLLALDTGCVWGGTLSAVRLSDREAFQANCQSRATPGAR